MSDRAAAMTISMMSPVAITIAYVVHSVNAEKAAEVAEEAGR